MKRILMLGTGETITCKRVESGLKLVVISDEILSCVPDSRSYRQVDTIQILNIDSTNIQPSHWLIITVAIEEHCGQYDSLVITHGTDTTAYAANALSHLIQHLQRPIVITEAQKPIDMKGTNARTSLTDNPFSAPCDKAHDVNIIFDDGAIVGARGKKERTKSYNVLSSINFPNVTMIQEDHIIFYLDDKGRDRETVKFLHGPDSNVRLLKLVSSVDASLLDYMAEHYDTVIIESSEVGSLSSYEQDGYYRTIFQWTGLGRTVAMTTQVVNGGSSMSVCKVGQSIKRGFGLLEAYGMTLEIVVTKIMWIPGQTEDPKKIRRLSYETISRNALWHQDSIHRAR